MEDAVVTPHIRRRSIRKTSQSSYIIRRNEQIELRRQIKRVSEILKKPEQERTTQDKTLVKKNPELVKVSQQNARKLQNKKERILEVEDEQRILLHKCEQLAELIKSSKNVIVYTGAGISTAASIPDYRGPNGVWTLLKRGQELSPQDLSDAEPTFTHMALTKLFNVKKVKHIVSQNCDGLHLRSGFPRQAISEVHGNMYIECCYCCAPNKEFVRLFDVTELTGFHRHSTSRFCRSCGGNLQDTIVHFGEKGKLKSPYRWKEAVRAAKRADLILCLGSSLKVLRKYSCLWCMDRKPQHRPKLVIVNLQWTPKDDGATLKINGKCDTVMMNVMALLNYKVPEYKRGQDPIFKLYTPLRLSEMKSTTKKILIPPAQQGKKSSKPTTYISNSDARRKSCRVRNSAEKHASLPDKKYFKPSIKSLQSDHFNLNDAKETERNQMNSNKENLLNEDISGLSARLKFDQHKSADYSTSALNNVNPDSPWDVTDLQLFHTSGTLWDFSDKICGKSILQPECITCAVPQKHWMLRTMSDHCSCDCKLEKGGLNMMCSTLEMEQCEKCRNCHCCCVLHERQTSTLENSDTCRHEEYLSFQHKNIPELVVVNLGKIESQKCIDQNIFHNEHLNTGDTILLLSDLATDNTLSNLVSDVCQNSSLSAAAHNSTHMLDSVFRTHAASNDLIHSSKELNNSPVQINFKENQQFFGQCLEVTSDSDIILLPAREDAECDQFSDALFSNKNCDLNCLGNGILIMEHNESNNMEQQLNKTLQTVQPVKETINNICHDHCYTLAETTVTHQQQTQLPWLQTTEYTCELHGTCGQKDVLDMSITGSPKISLFANNIPHSVSNLYTYKQAHSLSKPSTQAELQFNTNSIHINSLHLSDGKSCRSIGSSAVECHPCIQTEERSSNPNWMFVEQGQQSGICSFSDVPACILNMDDMNIVYADADNQAELSLYFSDDSVHGHTLPPGPAAVTFPWNYDILVLPSEHEQSDVCQSKVHTHRNTLVPDSCFIVTEKSTFCCSEHHVNCFTSDDLTKHPEVLVTGTSSDGNLQYDKNTVCHLKDTYLKLQQKLDKKEVANNVTKKCHQISEMLHVQKSGINDLERRENICKQMRRPKPSVPGWFGKGLIIKKKKR